MKKYVGVDLALTHSAIGYISDTGDGYKYVSLLSYVTKNSFFAIHYKLDTIAKVVEVAKSIAQAIASGLHEDDQIEVCIDYDVTTQFNSARIQTAYLGILLGALLSELQFPHRFVNPVTTKIISPAMVRAFAGLKRNSKKDIVVNWFWKNTPLSAIDPSKYSEDEQDTMILSYLGDKV